MVLQLSLKQKVQSQLPVGGAITAEKTNGIFVMYNDFRVLNCLVSIVVVTVPSSGSVMHCPQHCWPFYTYTLTLFDLLTDQIQTKFGMPQVQIVHIYRIWFRLDQSKHKVGHVNFACDTGSFEAPQMKLGTNIRNQLFVLIFISYFKIFRSVPSKNLFSQPSSIFSVSMHS